MLCGFVHTSFSWSPFLSLSSSASFSISPSPCFPLLICFSPVGFGIPFREHIIQFLSFPEDGPRAAEWVTMVPPTTTTPLPASPTHSSLLAMRWCHGFYLLRGYTPILSRCYTLHISHFQPPTLTNLHSCFPQPVHFPDSLAPPGAPWGFEDVWMLFRSSLAHVRHPRGRQSPIATAASILNLIDLSLYCHRCLSHSCDRL